MTWHINERYKDIVRLKEYMDGLGDKKAFDELEYEVFSVNAPPSVAASVVIYRRPMIEEYQQIEDDSVLWSYESLSQLNSIPIVINVYPGEQQQTAVFAFRKGYKSILKYMVPSLGETDTILKSSLLSRTIIEESEMIMVSPKAWKSFGPDRRASIETHFRETQSFLPNPPWTGLRDPRTLNLFHLE